jgi:hypothetical protein
MTVNAHVKRLRQIRADFTRDAATEKLALMQSLRRESIPRASVLKSLHQSLCFVSAFPDSLTHHREARQALDDFAQRTAFLGAKEKDALRDTGIEGTRLYYRFSYDTALWLSRHCNDAVEIDWEEIDDAGRLDELLRHIVLPGEADFYDSGQVSEREWISLARGRHPVTDFKWLMVQLGSRRSVKEFWSKMYDAVDLPLDWPLGPRFAKGRNTLLLNPIKARPRGMRRLDGNARNEITRPLRSIRRLEKADGAKAITAAMAALAVRHRETYHFNHANPEEVYVAGVGEGVQIVVYGLLPEHRFILETTMGYLITSNGMPVGYGGASALFHQANTGINIFDEYRGSEAAYLWIQVLRTYHHLFRCRHFVVNPYQTGAGNKEALRSGAFWFYYRLGFRPVLPEIADLAATERARVEEQKSYRSDLATLRRLTCCDMHLRLRGARKQELFAEQWLETCAAAATDVLSGQNATGRRSAAQQAADALLCTLGCDPSRNWSKDERRALLQQAPVMSVLSDLKHWTRAERADLVGLIRLKGGPAEREYAKKMRQHDRLRRSLAGYCRNKKA